MGEADDAVEWMRIMSKRYRWGELSAGTAEETEAIGEEGREGGGGRGTPPR
jgi:hypothetical protein